VDVKKKTRKKEKRKNIVKVNVLFVFFMDFFYDKIVKNK